MPKKINKQEKQVISYSILIILGVIFIITIFKVGPLGTIIDNIFEFIFGDFYLIYFAIAGVFLIKRFVFKNKKKIKFKLFLSTIFICAGLLMANSVHHYNINNNLIDYHKFGVFEYIFNNLNHLNDKTISFYGGIIGAFIFSLFELIVSPIGAIIVCVLLFFLSIFILIPINSYKKFNSFIYNFLHSARLAIKDIMIKSLSNNKPKKVIQNDNESFEHVQETAEETYNVEETQEEILEDNEDINSENDDSIKEEAPEILMPEDSKPKIYRKNPFAGYKLPPYNLLDKALSFNSNKNQTTATVKGKKLIEVLRTFGIKAALIDTHIGPSVTKFEIKPDSSVNLNKICSLTDNIKMELAAREIRIEAPIPGKNAVGIEIPNEENVSVRMSELISKVPDKQKNNPLLFAVGKDITGKPVYCEINKMPHLLIGGETGSGKSVCLNTIITSIILRTRPDELKLVLVDPKRVEFTPYHDIPHLLWPVVTDAKMASDLLIKIVSIMKERFNIFSSAGVRDIYTYNEKVSIYNSKNTDKLEKMPFIVVIIDELADLMTYSMKEVEQSIQRITQLARASGIHLIIATQRPSTDVITGLIKSNIPSRIAFEVMSAIDSRTILDQTGAERLLGNGDMLYKPQGINAPLRLQGCYVSDDEIKAITDYVKSQAKPEYDDTYYQLKRTSDDDNTSNSNDAGDDALYDQVVEFIKTSQKASTSLIQRRFGIGYNRSARIIDTLEARGLIGPANGSKAREVYIKKEKDEE